MITHRVTIWASGPGLCFDGKVGHDILVRATATPFHDAARALLAQGLAEPDDVITARLAGTSYDILRATVGKAAKL
jgi:hypothetical protein